MKYDNKEFRNLLKDREDVKGEKKLKRCEFAYDIITTGVGALSGATVVQLTIFNIANKVMETNIDNAKATFLAGIIGFLISTTFCGLVSTSDLQQAIKEEKEYDDIIKAKIDSYYDTKMKVLEENRKNLLRKLKIKRKLLEEKLADLAFYKVATHQDKINIKQSISEVDLEIEEQTRRLVRG